jgi:ABC-2 type transport system ATP-binding protein
MDQGIHIESLTKTFRSGRVRALDGVSLDIAPGEVMGVIGPNGAGKTTLLGCLLGFLRPDTGIVTVAGRAPDDLSIRAVTGYLPERLTLDRWMTGRDFLAYHHALARLSGATRDTDVDAALALVGLDPAAGARAIARYSRGMLQRIGLAQALLGEPRFVFLDEPASGVDPAGVVLFRRLLAEVKARGATVVLNSHQLDQVERVCDRVAFVRQGRVEALETLHAGATLARVLRVRGPQGTIGGSVPRAALEEAAGRAGAELRDVAPPAARFAVTDEAGAVRLVQALVAAGVPITEVAPEEGRLERLFLAEEAAGAAPAGEQRP